jgi:hypothetical protein
MYHKITTDNFIKAVSYRWHRGRWRVKIAFIQDGKKRTRMFKLSPKRFTDPHDAWREGKATQVTYNGGDWYDADDGLVFIPPTAQNYLH